MGDAMPRLNEAETKFFESRGQDMAPSLSEGLPKIAEPAGEPEIGRASWRGRV